jgi:predicted cobalt transporter CbtA
LLHKANDIIGQILLVVLFVVMGGMPLGVLVLGVINFIRAETRRGTIVLQILASLLIWTFFTYALVLILMVVIFSYEYPISPNDEIKTNAIVLIGTVIYAAVGAALIYWTRRQAKLSTAVRR